MEEYVNSMLNTFKGDSEAEFQKVMLKLRAELVAAGLESSTVEEERLVLVAAELEPHSGSLVRNTHQLNQPAVRTADLRIGYL